MVSPRLRWWSVVAGSLLLVAAVTGLVSAWRRLNAAAATDHPTRRVAVVLPDTAPIAFHAATKLGSPQRALAISPDASVITYVARVRDTTMLYARRLDAAHVEPLAGTEGAHAPFFSPDSRWIAFFRGSLLARIPVNGGGAIPVAEFVEPYSGTWRERDLRSCANLSDTESAPSSTKSRMYRTM